MEEPATAPAAQELSGAAEQPETSPAHAIRTTDIEGEGCSLAEEGDTHMQIASAEAVLSRQHPQAPTQDVHAQTASAELEAILGKPDAIEEGAHAHHDRAEPDLRVGQPGDPNANTPEGVARGEPDSMPGEDISPNAEQGESDTLKGVAHTQTVDVEPDLTRGEVADPMDARAHLEGAEPKFLMDMEGDWLLEEEGTAGENASVEGDRDPRVELQEPGVSRLATPEEVEFLTSPSSSSSPPDSEAASTQHSPVVNTRNVGHPRT